MIVHAAVGMYDSHMLVLLIPSLVHSYYVIVNNDSCGHHVY